MTIGSKTRKQLNVRVETELFEQLAARAKRDRRTIPQTAKLLLSDALRGHHDDATEPDPGVVDFAALASAGGAFDWVSEEPEVYSATSGEPL